MKQLLAAFAFLGLLCSTATGQEAVAPKSTPLQDVEVSGQPGLHSVTLTVDWAPGAATAVHTHPGDEYAVVIEGEVTISVDGQPVRVVKAGESYFNARGVVHSARNAGAVAARSVTVLVTDRDMPLLTPVGQ